MVKLDFQQPLLQSLVPHDPSEIILIRWFEAQETFTYSICVCVCVCVCVQKKGGGGGL